MDCEVSEQHSCILKIVTEWLMVVNNVARNLT